MPIQGEYMSRATSIPSLFHQMTMAFLVSISSFRRNEIIKNSLGKLLYALIYPVDEPLSSFVQSMSVCLRIALVARKLHPLFMIHHAYRTQEWYGHR